jgi:nickel-dependent lactate racemase
VKPGGSILLVGECAEGAGAPEFCEMVLEGISDRKFLDRIHGAPVTVDQWQLEKLALVTTRQKLLWYVPGLSAEYQSKLWGRAFASVEAAVQALTESLQPVATIAVIPEGPYVLARASEMAGVA